jgi:hypothetical protein
MALTPKALVEITAGLLKLPLSTVRNFDRQLMEAGLRSKKGHGRGSAIMTAADSATLLIALAASDQISRVPDCLIETRNLPIFCRPEGAFRSYSREEDIGAVSSIVGCDPTILKTFGSAIDAVMNYLVRNPGQEYLFTFNVDTVGGSPLTVELYVTRDIEDDVVRRIIFRKPKAANQYSSDCLRVVRFIPGTVLSLIAAEIGGGSSTAQDN